jgi:hypothetical protein
MKKRVGNHATVLPYGVRSEFPRIELDDQQFIQLETDPWSVNNPANETHPFLLIEAKMRWQSPAISPLQPRVHEGLRSFWEKSGWYLAGDIDNWGLSLCDH